MIRFFEKNKNRISLFTYILIFIMFCFFSLMDLQKRIADYHYLTRKINDIIRNVHESETIYTNLRTTNYVNTIIDQHDVASLVVSKDKAGLQKIFEQVYYDFRSRSVPATCISVVDLEGNLLFRKVDESQGLRPGDLVSQSLRLALDQGKPVYGFEIDHLPLHYSIALPIFSETGSMLVGAVKISINPAWFHFRLELLLENVKTAIVTDSKVLLDERFLSPVFEKYKSIFNTETRKENLAFFKSIIDDIDMSKEVIQRKVGNEYYLIGTGQTLLNPHNEPVGKLIVAYNISEFRDRELGYFYLWVAFFACTAIVLYLISYIGFKKYDKIITEQSKKMARHSKQCALGEMLGYIGHQWRQPLHTLSLVIQNIELQNRLGHLDNALLEKQVGVANKNIAYMTQIIEDWRALLASGSSRQAIDLADSVARAIDIATPALNSAQIRIENRITGTIKTESFVNDLVQCTVNVLLNAKDALCQQEGERIIVLSHREENGLITVTYQDNGGGIPTPLLEKVFDAYLTTKGEGTGTGLGLYLCRQIADNLDNGRVWAENREFLFEGKRYFGACISLQFKKTNQGGNVER